MNKTQWYDIKYFLSEFIKLKHSLLIYTYVLPVFQPHEVKHNLLRKINSRRLQTLFWLRRTFALLLYIQSHDI